LALGHRVTSLARHHSAMRLGDHAAGCVGHLPAVLLPDRVAPLAGYATRVLFGHHAASRIGNLHDSHLGDPVAALPGNHPAVLLANHLASGVADRDVFGIRDLPAHWHLNRGADRLADVVCLADRAALGLRHPDLAANGSARALHL